MTTARTPTYTSTRCQESRSPHRSLLTPTSAAGCFPLGPSCCHFRCCFRRHFFHGLLAWLLFRALPLTLSGSLLPLPLQLPPVRRPKNSQPAKPNQPHPPHTKFYGPTGPAACFPSGVRSFVELSSFFCFFFFFFLFFLPENQNTRLGVRRTSAWNF